MPTKKTGFTLIELLVVISIMAILGVAAFVNFRDFASTQSLKKAAGEIQSFLRLAQSNASSSTLCNGTGGVTWTVAFTDASTITATCGSNTPYKTLTLSQDVTMSSTCSSPVHLVYSALKGIPSNNCLPASPNVTIILTNSKGDIKNLIITSGGAIDVQ